MKNRIEIDGQDINERIYEMIESKFRKNIRIIMLNGITFGGFNICDIYMLNRDVGIPVISITRKKPDIPSMEAAIDHHLNDTYRIGVLRKMKPVAVLNGGHRLYINCSGIDLNEAIKIIKMNTIRGKIPEAIRIADLISKVSGRNKDEYLKELR